MLATDGVAEDFGIVLALGFADFNGLIERANPAHKASSSSLNCRRRLMALAAVLASAQPRRRRRQRRISVPAPLRVSVPATAHRPPWDLPWW
jgi:hypothetical protein